MGCPGRKCCKTLLAHREKSLDQVKNGLEKVVAKPQSAKLACEVSDNVVDVNAVVAATKKSTNRTAIRAGHSPNQAAEDGGTQGDKELERRKESWCERARRWL